MGLTDQNRQSGPIFPGKWREMDFPGNSPADQPNFPAGSIPAAYPHSGAMGHPVSNHKSLQVAYYTFVCGSQASLEV